MIHVMRRKEFLGGFMRLNGIMRFGVKILFVLLALAELELVAAEGPRKAPGKGFSVEGGDPGPDVSKKIEHADEELLKAEAELLKQLQSGDPTKANKHQSKLDAAGETEIIPVSLMESPTTSKKAPTATDNPSEPPSQPEQDDSRAMAKSETLKEQSKEDKIQPKELQAAKLKVSSLEKANSATNAQLEKSKAREAALLQEVQEIRNRLIIAETEVERLSSILESKNRSQLSKYSPKSAQPKTTTQGSVGAVNAAPKPHNQKVQGGMDTATVIADKAHLRAGPGKDNSILMDVPKGTRLAIETRRGDWYMVIAPTGERAWVSGDVLVFGEASRDPSSTVRIKGYDSSVEDRAIELIREHSR